MEWVALVLLVYFLGVGSHWWPGPLAVMTRAVSRLNNRWSDGDTTPEDDTPDDVMTPDEEGGDEDYTRRVSAENLRGPRPLDDLLEEAGTGGDDQPEDDDPDDDGSFEARRRWVAARMREGKLSATEIDRRGEARYGVDRRTIARDRRDITQRLAQRHRRGTVGRQQ
jgi:hypothetical protein